MRDIGKAVGLTSSSTVHAHLANLEKLGLLRRDPSKPRAIELLDRATRDARAAVSGVIGRVAPTAGLPVVGQVAAGQPILAEENIEEYVAVPPAAGGDDGEYVLRVRGDSMIDAGILEGDYVVVRPQETAGDGEIVVALVGRGGDRQAVLPRVRPRAPAAREPDDGADPDRGRARPRPGGGPLQERVMTVATLTLTRTTVPESFVRGKRLAVRGTVLTAPGSGRRPTLDDVLVGVWEGLRSDRRAGCPVCGGVMRASLQAGRSPVAGRCRDCGSTMS